MATKFNYYKVNDVYGTLFFQFPKVLIYGQRYRKLSADAKIAYVLLKNRLEYSIRNNWIDQQGNLYFIYPNSELQQLLGCHNQKVVKIKRELEAVNILKQTRMGFNVHTGKNEPNRLYLANLEVLATDVYLRAPINSQQIKLMGDVKSTLPVVASASSRPLGSMKSTLPDAVRPHLTLRRNVKITRQEDKDHRLETTRDVLETNRLDFNTKQYSPRQYQQQNADLVAHMSEFLTDVNNESVCLSAEILTLLSKWCNTPQQVHKFIGIILNAKRVVEKDPRGTGEIFILDEPELQALLLDTIRRYFNVIRSGKTKINNYDDYLFATMKNMFQVHWNIKQARRYRQRM